MWFSWLMFHVICWSKCDLLLEIARYLDLLLQKRVCILSHSTCLTWYWIGECVLYCTRPSLIEFLLSYLQLNWYTCAWLESQMEMISHRLYLCLGSQTPSLVSQIKPAMVWSRWLTNHGSCFLLLDLVYLSITPLVIFGVQAQKRGWSMDGDWCEVVIYWVWLLYFLGWESANGSKTSCHWID